MLEIQAHRGNSEPALRSLLAASPTSVEIDVGVTGDGAVVVSHEVRATTVECLPSPLLGKPWPELSAADARAAHAGRGARRRRSDARDRGGEVVPAAHGGAARLRARAPALLAAHRA